MGGVFITLDLLGHVRAANSEGQVDAPLLLADDNGVFMLQSGWWGGYRKKYVDGRLSGASVEIDVAEFERLREIAYLIFGRRDFFGRWQPGMLQKELPLISLPYPECVEVGVACEA